jgi:hypothetical protein
VTDFKVIFTGILPNVTEVRLYDETITKVTDDHLEIPIGLPCIDTAMTKAICNPTHVEGSYGNSVVYVDAETTNVSGDPFRVPVKIVSGTSGRVKSFYFASSNSTGKIIWSRGDE